MTNPIAPLDPLLSSSNYSKMSLSKLAVAGGWADLPRDLLESVLARLPVPDRVRFPAVCTAWQSAHAAAAGVQQATTLSPWLMLPYNPTARAGGVVDDDDGSCGKLSVARFLSLAEGRAYAIRQPAPAARDRLCVGSSPDGWLVTADGRSELSLLNPVTGAQVLLPPADTLPFVDARRGADGRVESYGLRFLFADGDGGCGGGGGEEDEAALVLTETLAPDRLRFEVYEKAVVVSPPRRRRVGSGSSSSSCCWGDYAVLLICQPLGRLAVARAGDAAWTLLDADAPGRCFVDAVRSSSSSGADHQQPVYTMDAAGRVDAWDMGASAATHSSRAVAPPCVCSARACCATSAGCRRYLVELSPGRLLQVHRLREAAHARYAWEPRPEHVEYTTTGVELFEWIAGRWTRVEDGKVLGGRALFLGKSASLFVPAGCGVRGDCVYFTDDGPWSHDRCHEVAPDVGVLDLADGSYTPPRGAARDLLWKWPPPVWVFPSLAA